MKDYDMLPVRVKCVDIERIEFFSNMLDFVIFPPMWKYDDSRQFHTEPHQFSMDRIYHVPIKRIMDKRQYVLFEEAI